MPPTFRAAILRFGHGNRPASCDQLTGFLSHRFSWGAAAGTLWILTDPAGMVGQYASSELASHHVADPDHFILDIVDVPQFSTEAQRPSANISATNALTRSSTAFLYSILGSFA